jgi:hypothetical protein
MRHNPTTTTREIAKAVVREGEDVEVVKERLDSIAKHLDHNPAEGLRGALPQIVMDAYISRRDAGEYDVKIEEVLL